MLYPISGTYGKAGVKKKGKGAPVLDTSASGDAAPAKAAEGYGPVSRGYREENRTLGLVYPRRRPRKPTPLQWAESPCRCGHRVDRKTSHQELTEKKWPRFYSLRTRLVRCEFRRCPGSKFGSRCQKDVCIGTKKARHDRIVIFFHQYI